MSGLASFLPVPVGGRQVLGHDNLYKRYQVPIDGRELSCQDETVYVASKKQGTSASARSPSDFVLAAGFVLVAQNFISWTEFNRIDFGVSHEVVRAAEGT